MQNFDQDHQDQRKSFGMEDSNAMTIEFLRARLLSERSVSKSARQRADELARRVMELEEQLKIVSIQRKMAEKATTEVLAILENQGISDVSEEYDFSSEHESPCDAGVVNDSLNEESSISSKARINRSYELSGSDCDSSKPGKSLSWKGCNDSICSLDKYKASNVRRRSSFSSISSFPKQRQGKSCRQIRRRETGSVIEEFKEDRVKSDSQENRIMMSAEGFPDFSNSRSDIMERESCIQGDVSELRLGNHENDLNGHRGENMEKALKHQEKLICQYEAMEKVQREWEEKFKENNSSTLDSCDPGNHSDITDEQDDIKGQGSYPAGIVTSNAENTKSEPGDSCLSNEVSGCTTKPKSFTSSSNIDARSSDIHTSTTFSDLGSLSKNLPDSLVKKHNQEIQENSHCHHSDSSGKGPCSHNFPKLHSSQECQSTYGTASNLHSGLSQIDAPEQKNNIYAMVPHEPKDSLYVILESLKQARLSLKQKISSLPSTDCRYSGNAAEPSACATKSNTRFEIPVGCSGLFRLPTDFSAEKPTSRADFVDSATRFSSAEFYFEKGIGKTSGDQLISISSPYVNTGLSFVPERQSFSSSQHAESRLRFDTQSPRFNYYLDRELPGFSKSMHPATHPIIPSHQQSMQRMPFSEVFSKPSPSRAVEILPSENFSFYNDHLQIIRPNNYNRW